MVDKLNAVVKELYHNQEGKIIEKVKGLGPSIEAIFNYLEQKGLEPAGDEAQKKYLEEIVTYLKTLPIVKITLAFEPDDQFTVALNQVISDQAGQKVILDISVNHHIVAGIQMEYQGKFADYSYEAKTDQYLKERLASYLTKTVEAASGQKIAEA